MIPIDRHARTEDLRYDCAKRTSIFRGLGRVASYATVGDVMRGFGADDDKLAAIERFLGEIVERANSLVVAAAPTFLLGQTACIPFRKSPRRQATKSYSGSYLRMIP